MRIAWFSPLPPMRTGISDYSVLVLRALSARAQVDLWVTESAPAYLAHRHRVFHYGAEGAAPERLRDYDAILYNIGNHAGFHGAVYETLRRKPGIVILHDFALQTLMRGHYGAAIDVPAFCAADPLRYPLNEMILESATGVIVHSHFVELRVRDAMPRKPVRRLNHPAFPVPSPTVASREDLGLPTDRRIVTSLGFITENKGSDAVIEAIRRDRRLRRSVFYLLVGERPPDYAPALARLGANAACTGFVPIARVYDYLRHSDVVVNLRNPSMGETSASLLRALSVGRAAIVSDIAWYAELPDDCVVKIDPRRHAAVLPTVLHGLLDDPARRATLGAAGTRYLDAHCRPGAFAEGLLDFARTIGDEARALRVTSRDFARSPTGLASPGSARVGELGSPGPSARD